MYLSLYCKGLKRVTQGFTVRGSWRPTRTATFWLPLLWPSALCLSCSPGLLNQRPRAPAFCWMMAFFTASNHQLVWSPTQSGALRTPSAWCGFPYHILSATSLDPNSSGAPRAPSAWCGLPYHISSITPTPTVWLLSWLSCIIVQRPLNRLLDLWNVMFDCHQVEINCPAVHRSLFSGASVYECTMEILACPIL